MSHKVVIKDILKRFGDFIAVNQVNIEIQEGEFFTLLGPSGCGKTTLLRMIAGFHEIDGGEIMFGDKSINQVAAHKRDIGMVFQNYAIFPHLSVYENVAYGLRAQKVKANEIDRRVKEALDLVQISVLADRMPAQLSGGQQQRVALARAVVIEPKVLLMDEPLSNLDAKLRVQMRTVIKKLQRRLGITTIYVTHDQEEALAISDRIAIMKDGNIMQIGTPEEVYLKPKNQFVAGFIGTSNFLEGELAKQNKDIASLTVSGLQMELSCQEYDGEVIVSARPEQLFFADSGIAGEIILATFLGDFVCYEILLDNQKSIELNEYRKDTASKREVGERVYVRFDATKISIYRKDTHELLTW